MVHASACSSIQSPITNLLGPRLNIDVQPERPLKERLKTFGADYRDGSYEIQINQVRQTVECSTFAIGPYCERLPNRDIVFLDTSSHCRGIYRLACMDV